MKRLGKYRGKYYIKKTLQNGKVSVQGTKLLQSTAAYTPTFCRALLGAWKRQTGY